MSLQEKIEKFNRRWNIEDISTNEGNFQKFKIRVLNIFFNIDEDVTKKSITLFCQCLGIEDEWHINSLGDDEWCSSIIDSLTEETDEVEFYKKLEIIFSLEFPGRTTFDHQTVDVRECYYLRLLEALGFSKVNVSVTKTTDGEVVFYPKGEQYLDSGLVDGVLSFLEGKSSDHFKDGLSFYQDKNWVKSAESLRRSLEEFLRGIFNNQAGLANNLTKLGQLLKDEKSPAQTRNIVAQTFGYLDKYFDDNSKHNDGDIAEDEAEFLIYQVALLMRYISKIKGPLAQK